MKPTTLWMTKKEQFQFLAQNLKFCHFDQARHNNGHIGSKRPKTEILTFWLENRASDFPNSLHDDQKVTVMVFDRN